MTDKNEFSFVKEEAPPREQRGRKSDWLNRLTPLMDEPGVTFRIFEGTPNSCHATASRLRKLKYPGGSEDWLFVARTLVKDEKGAVWATYKPPADAD